MRLPARPAMRWPVATASRAARRGSDAVPARRMRASLSPAEAAQGEPARRAREGGAVPLVPPVTKGRQPAPLPQKAERATSLRARVRLGWRLCVRRTPALRAPAWPVGSGGTREPKGRRRPGGGGGPAGAVGGRAGAEGGEGAGGAGREGGGGGGGARG